MTSRFKILLPLLQLFMLVAILLIFTRHVFYFDFVCDDAFISFRYAENLAHHGELAFNLGQRIEGYSNFLWTLLLAAGAGLGADTVWLSKILGWVFGALGIALVWRVGQGRTPDDARGADLDALPGRVSLAVIFESQTAILLTATLVFMGSLILAMASSYACWSSGGLETQAFTLLVAGAIFRFLIEERDEEAGEGPRRWSGLLFALATMTRPEGAAYFLMAAAWRAGKVLLRTRRRELSASESAASLRRDLGGLALFFAPIVPWLMWRVYYYGDILPNTYYIKSGGPDMILRGAWDLGIYFSMTKLYILLPPMALGWLSGLRYFRERWGEPRSGLSMSFLLLVVAATILYYVWIGGDFMELARFLVPALPLAALVSQEGIFLLYNIAGAGHGRASAYSLVLKWVFFFTVITFFAFYGQTQLAASAYAMTDHSRGGTDSIGYLKKATHQWKIVGTWLRNDAEKRGRTHATLATSAAGAIPYYTGMTTLDLLGLNDPVIPRMNLKIGNRPGHTRGADWSYIRLWDVDYFVGHPEIEPKPKTLSASDLGYMKALGYERRVVTPAGLDPPYFQFWYRTD
jgi:arabinofuranosyltransferase